MKEPKEMKDFIAKIVLLRQVESTETSICSTVTFRKRIEKEPDMIWSGMPY